MRYVDYERLGFYEDENGGTWEAGHDINTGRRFVHYKSKPDEEGKFDDIDYEINAFVHRHSGTPQYKELLKQIDAFNKARQKEEEE